MPTKRKEALHYLKNLQRKGFSSLQLNQTKQALIEVLSKSPKYRKIVQAFKTIKDLSL